MFDWMEWLMHASPGLCIQHKENFGSEKRIGPYLMDGFEATKTLIAQRICPSESTYIVALTANTSSQDKLACQQAGMDMFVSKPFKLPHIEKALSNALEHTAKVNSL
jgi:CheY-like chemotaxis protein